MSEYIQTKKEGAVLQIKLNRPAKYNSFIREMALAMQKALNLAQTDPSVRAVLLTGEGKAFCAGQDLAEATDPNGPELSKIVTEHYNPIILQMRSLQKPIVVAVNGVAAGAGANIALAGDIVFAAESASFIQAFSKIGLIPDSGGTYTLPRLVGLQQASALMMLGEKVEALRAQQMGMIYRCVNDQELFSIAMATAEKLAAMPTLALARTKELLNQTYQNDLEEQLKLEDTFQTECGKSNDYQEGTQAFLEKRKAHFKGN
jgi:2-(1,2-epoxy-1,2-dihydrophenyl)acetyl-CoA isomerase